MKVHFSDFFLFSPSRGLPCFLCSNTFHFLFYFQPATYVHQSSDGTSYVITSEPTSFDTNSSVSMTTISESNPSLVSTSETVDTTGIPLEQFAAHHTHQVDHEDHSTLYVLQDDSGGQDQEVWKTFNCQLHFKHQGTFLLTVFFFFCKSCWDCHSGNHFQCSVQQIMDVLLAFVVKWNNSPSPLRDIYI